MNKMNKKNQRFFCPSIFSKSRKGDVPVMILVLGVFAICAIAILSFYSSATRSKGDIGGFAIMEEANSRVDEYYFYSKFPMKEQAIIEMLELEEDNKGLYVNFSHKDVTIIYYLD